ncbi:MAG: hypothetical protein PHC73_12075, partial [Immundisolibacter sp.]
EGRAKNRRVVLVVLATPDAVAERELALSLSRQGPQDTGLRLPEQLPSAQSILSASRAPAGQAPPAAAPRASARWPAERRAAGEVPPFVPAPPLPQVAPPL